jgi:hypothetical protein
VLEIIGAPKVRLRKNLRRFLAIISITYGFAVLTLYDSFVDSFGRWCVGKLPGVWWRPARNNAGANRAASRAL